MGNRPPKPDRFGGGPPSLFLAICGVTVLGDGMLIASMAGADRGVAGTAPAIFRA